MSEPFSHDQEALISLIQRTQAGDDLAFEELLNAYEPMIKAQVHRFTSGNPALVWADMKQEADICFYHAINKFDVTKTGVAFGVFASICIHNWLVSRLRADKGTILVPVGGDIRRDSPTPDLINLLIAEESYLELYEKVQTCLSDYESKIWWPYVAGRTAKEIAALVGKDTKSVNNALYRIRQKLRKVIPSP